MTSSDQTIAVIRNVLANKCIKNCLLADCKNCLFRSLKDTYAQKRYDWFYEEHKDLISKKCLL